MDESSHATNHPVFRVGVVGAGRVGAVLAAALRSAGHEIVAVGGESNASRTRIETMLPGVAVAKPTAVAKAADLLLLTVPDDALDNVVKMLVASGAIRRGQYVVHTSGRHGLAVLAPGRRGRRPADCDAPGDDVHRHRPRPAQAGRLRLRRHGSIRRAGGRREAGARSARTRHLGARGAPNALSRGSCPWCEPPGDAGRGGDGAAPRGWLRRSGRYFAPLAHCRTRQHPHLRRRRVDRSDHAW